LTILYISKRIKELRRVGKMGVGIEWGGEMKEG
jgi:hypothetical protein